MNGVPTTYYFVIIRQRKERRGREAEEMGDAMKCLENRALDSKQDMDILAALEEMKSMKVWTC